MKCLAAVVVTLVARLNGSSGEQPQRVPVSGLLQSDIMPASELQEVISRRAVELSQLTAAAEQNGIRGRGLRSWQLNKFMLSMQATFGALASNHSVGTRASRYLLHNYFAREFGWLVRGLEPAEGVSVPQLRRVLAESGATGEHRRLVTSLLESWMSKEQLGLEDVAAAAAELERLLIGEAVALLEVSYQLSKKERHLDTDTEGIMQILGTHVQLMGIPSRSGSPALEHRADSLGEMLELHAGDEIMSLAYSQRHSRNPFRPPAFSFIDAAEVVGDLAQSHGRVKAYQCQHMRDALVSLAPQGSGRVPLAKFVAAKGGDHRAAELVDTLRQLGALDESVRSRPKVLVANYIASPGFCVPTMGNYEVCCLSECEDLMNEIEEKVQAPAAAPQFLLELLGNMSSSSVDGKRQFPASLEQKLHQIAALHGGEVKLYGRLFAQWLHFAFPNECPYPHVGDEGVHGALTPSQWVRGGENTANPEERSRHAQVLADLLGAAAEIAPRAESPNLNDSDEEGDGEFLLQWRDEEELLLSEKGFFPQGAVLRRVLRCGAQGFMILALLRAALQMWIQSSRMRVSGTSGGGAMVAQAKKADLPL